MTENQDESNNERIVMASGPDLVFVATAIVLWILPLTWVGMTDKRVPFAGVYTNDMYRVASLFTHRLQNSVDYYFQVQLEDDWIWVDVPKSDYASIVMNGARTRLDRVLADSVQSDVIGYLRGIRQRQSIAEFIKKRYEDLHPDAAKVESVRFIIVSFPLEKLATQKGKWIEWPIERIPEGQKQEMSVHYFDGRDAKNSLKQILEKQQERSRSK